MATKAELEAQNAELRAQLNNSTASTEPADVNALADGEYVETADGDGRFVDAVGNTHTFSEGDSIVHNDSDAPVRVISAEDATDDEPAQ